MKILVTGASGFVGEALCRRLAASGDQVVGVYRDAPPPRRWMEVRVAGDLTEITDFTSLVSGVDAVVHLAARVHMMRETAADPEAAFAKANTDVTRSLAEAAVRSGVGRFVFLSSIKVNGEETPVTPYTPGDTPSPSDAYGRSKLGAETALGEIAAKSEMAVTMLRIPLVYGPGVRANFASLMRICDTALPLPLDGITKNRRSLLYLGNLTHAIETVVNAGRVQSGVYLLSDGADISTAGLVARLRRSLNRHTLRLSVPARAIRTLAALAGKQNAADRLCGSLQINSAAFCREFDWLPQFSVDQGIAATVAAYRALR